eukprot:3537733-Prymnesium_polylepis.1
MRGDVGSSGVTWGQAGSSGVARGVTCGQAGSHEVTRTHNCRRVVDIVAVLHPECPHPMADERCVHRRS